MSRKKLSKRDVDQLLQSAFRDDMPAEIEERMRRQIPDFWLRASNAGPSIAQATVPDSAAIPAWYPLSLNLRRALWAACAVFMLIFGGALRLGHTSSFLTESIALRQTASSVTGRIERARQMECRVQARNEQGSTVRYLISWAEGRDSRVEIDGPEGKQVLFAAAPRMRTSMVSIPWQAGRIQPTGSRPQGRWFEPIREFLSAPAIAELLAGQWRATPMPGAGDKNHAAYFIWAEASPNLSLVVVDLQTYLPVSYIRFPKGSGEPVLNFLPLLKVEFRWDSRLAIPRQP
jgi:hypothetical protein